jgi:O-antigen ligase
MLRIPAAIACFGLVGYLFWQELRRPDRDRISWLPFVWMFIAGSRFASRWLSLGTTLDVVGSYDEGNSFDRTVFLMLIAWGTVVLAKRNIQWGRLIASNKWLVAYLAFCFVSMAWTDAPFILLKRWVKDLGNPIVALVLLTEQKPYDALVTTLRRLAFIWLPVSILFIRYYPEFGRSYSPGGGVQYSGIADQKNTLGLSCLLVGMACGWKLLLKRDSFDRYDWLNVGLLVWVLFLSNSKTSLGCLLVAIAILAYAARNSASPRPNRLIAVTVVLATLYVASDSLFNVREYVLDALNRDSTLTNRTEVWDVVLSLSTNPMVGTGFMSFWTGDRMRAAAAMIGVPINQAHNGYLEQYVNLGYIGVAFIILIAVAALFSVSRHLRTDYSAGALRFSIIVVALLYNYTEASFYGINNMWVLFLGATMTPALVPNQVAISAARDSANPLLIGSRVPLPRVHPRAVPTHPSARVRVTRKSASERREQAVRHLRTKR